jgi:hypothetical protein
MPIEILEPEYVRVYSDYYLCSHQSRTRESRYKGKLGQGDIMFATAIAAQERVPTKGYKRNNLEVFLTLVMMMMMRDTVPSDKWQCKSAIDVFPIKSSHQILHRVFSITMLKYRRLISTITQNYF